MKTHKNIAWFALILFAITANAAAATIAPAFDQPLNNLFDVGGWNSNGPDNPAQFFPPTAAQMADDFTLGSGTILTGVSWYGQYLNTMAADPVARDFVVRIFSDVPGAPNGQLFEQRASIAGVDTGQSTLATDRIMSYDLSLVAAPLLSAGETYWVSIMENDVSTPKIWRWSYGGIGDNLTGPIAKRHDEASPWEIPPFPQRNLAFSLEGAAVVPLPAPLLPMSAALAVLGLIRRKRT